MNENPPKQNPEAGSRGSEAGSFEANPLSNTEIWIRKSSRPKFLWPAAVALAVVLFFGLGYLFDALTHESTDDAFIAGHIVSIAPRMAGQVSAVHILDNQMVRSNDLLVEIDPADYATTLALKQAANNSSSSNFKAATAGYKLMEVKVTTAEATAKETKADAESAAATAAKAKADFERAKNLRTNDTISAQEFDQFKAATDKAAADYNSAERKAEADGSKVAEAQAQLEAAKAESEAVFAQFSQSKTEVDSAQLNLSYTKIFAPCDGRVTRKSVEAGDYLQTGEQIFSIVPVEVWVVANFKESQLKKMKPGQLATVRIDALGGRKFRARVDSIQAGSGAQFSLLPPENATGNFVKVIQRVPVKILFDEPLPADKTIGPGMSVEPSVQVVSFHVPEFVTAILAIVLTGAAVMGFKRFFRRQIS
jgi:membrane fusion protein (multidrug efflux system)